MRRLLVVLLCFSILLPCICISVKADKDYTFYNININSGSGIIAQKAIVQDSEIYIPATSFSSYTRFAYDEENNLFLIKGQELKKTFKTVKIDINKKRMLVSGTHLYELSDCFEIEGELYLPLCQMLPVLNADICKVENDVICIANNELSLAEVLYDFDISEYYFNLSSEFQNKTWATSLTIIPNYILDTVVNVRFDRLDIVFGSGKYNDYKNAFSDFLSEDNLYLKAMAQEENIIDETITFFNKANSTAKNMRTAYKWVETAGETKISSETGGMLLESLQAYYNSGDLDTDDLKQLNDAWNEDVFHHGTLSFGNCIELMNYTYTYATLVEDNRQMLNAVYDVDGKVSKKENDRRAAQRIYDLYGEDVAPALVSEIVRNIASDELENLSPIGIYTATAKVAGTALKLVMPFSFEGIASLPTYSDVVLTASSKYLSYDTTTDKSTENLRLSLLLCMIASKKCFETMDDVLDKNNSYYKSKIEKIDRLIMGLYITAENTTFDSFEHFEEYRKTNLKKIEVSTQKLLAESPENPLPPNNEIPHENFKNAKNGKISVWDGSVATSFSKGNGSQTDPYVINSAAELAYVSKLCAEGHNFSGKFLRLNCNINLNGLEWTPIGILSQRMSCEATPTNTPDFKDFQGSFDGAGHFVSNFSINKGMSWQGSQELYGLFGAVRTATIKNLIVKDYNITARGEDSGIGGLAGVCVDTCYFENCHTINGNITVHLIGNCTTTGGLIGEIAGDDSENEDVCATTLLNCSSDATIRINCDISMMPYDYGDDGERYYPDKIIYDVGGLVGSHYGSQSITNNCFAKGSITVSTARTDAEENALMYYSHIGGLMAYTNSATVKNCYSAVDILSEKDVGLESFGGLIGKAEKTTVTNCYSSGSLEIGKPKYHLPCGGLIGESLCYIEDCFVIGEYTWSTKNKYSDFLVGKRRGSDNKYAINNCYVSNSCRIKETTPDGSHSGYYKVVDKNCFSSKDFIVNELDFQEKTVSIVGETLLVSGYSGWVISDNSLPKMFYEEQISSIVTTTPPVANNTSGDTQKLLKEIQDFLENGYLSIAGFKILDMEIYNDDEEILTVNVTTTNEYAHYGFDYYKKTRVIEFYNTGNFIFSDTLP